MGYKQCAGVTYIRDIHIPTRALTTGMRSDIMWKRQHQLLRSFRTPNEVPSNAHTAQSRWLVLVSGATTYNRLEHASLLNRYLCFL